MKYALQHETSHQLIHTMIKLGNKTIILRTSESYLFQYPYEVLVTGQCWGKREKKEKTFGYQVFLVISKNLFCNQFYYLSENKYLLSLINQYCIQMILFYLVIFFKTFHLQRVFKGGILNISMRIPDHGDRSFLVASL